MARALANLSSNEENHATVYAQEGLRCLIVLTGSSQDICRRYAAMGLRFLASNADVRVRIVADRLLQPFLVLAAVRETGRAMEHASKRLRGDATIALVAVSDYGYALPYVEDPARSDKTVVLAAVTNEGRALKYARDLVDDSEVVLVAVRQFGLAVQHASERLRKEDREIAMAAVTSTFARSA